MNQARAAASPSDCQRYTGSPSTLCGLASTVTSSCGSGSGSTGRATAGDTFFSTTADACSDACRMKLESGSLRRPAAAVICFRSWSESRTATNPVLTADLTYNAVCRQARLSNSFYRMVEPTR
jgi:hypothetical protein